MKKVRLQQKKSTQENRFRLTGRTSTKPRRPFQLQIKLPKIHDLSDDRYKVHEFVGSPKVFAIRTQQTIELHELLLYQGKVHKVVSVEKVETGDCLEIKTLIFPRLNNGPN
jgi:hypothetical protein